MIVQAYTNTRPPTAKYFAFSSTRFQGSLYLSFIYYFDTCDLAIKVSNRARQMKRERKRGGEAPVRQNEIECY